ncbi:MAG: hypothetical protein M1823_003833 [Watsoniomyces obsoletus]|nr:MAG: hypothetical protein M1823_003833 [Watsoniomyces obsoletus]
MAEETPYAAQNPQEVAELVRNLEEHTKKGAAGGKKSFSCRKTTFPVPGPGNQTVESWRFQDWDYKRKDLPTHARGLFTQRSANGTPEIVVRGYDKFFNVGEVRTTEWDNIKKDTRGPYELSLKENGCIIFISGLADGTLLVCSKHSTGARQDTDVSHALAGEKWVDRQLAALGKSRGDLARELRKRNATAVAELCDDSFEEHILAYKNDDAGLYLHGINLNLPHFATYPGPLVHRFADEWGFKKTDFLMKDDIESVKKFLEQVGETGAYNGRDVEGFVVRCHALHAPSGPWGDWFFKYKYEEPYLMYRQWREVTKQIIAGKPAQYKKHKKITEQYLQYARRRLAQDPKLGKAFNQNHGIIAMRNGFLAEKGLKGADVIREAAREGSLDVVTKDVVLLPAATIGCGKTTVALALCKLFQWGHVQNDNIQGSKGRPQRFATEVNMALTTSLVVIADRNNHQRRERKQIIEDVQKVIPSAKFVALHYVHDKKGGDREDYKKSIRAVTRERVFSRGDNHQTIQAGSKSEGEIRGIMDGFLGRFEPVDTDVEPDDAFDTVIDLDPTAASRENLETVVAKLHEHYPKLFGEMPTSDDLDRAIEAAMKDYQPNVKHDLSFASKNKNKNVNNNNNKNHQQQDVSMKKEKKEPQVEYFCIALPTQQVLDTVATTFASQDPTTAKFYHQLQKTRRIQSSVHVTLVHRANAKKTPDLWTQFNEMLDRKRKAAWEKQEPAGAAAEKKSVPIDIVLTTCRIQLERIVWDHRVMCVVVRLLGGAGGGGGGGAGGGGAAGGEGGGAATDLSSANSISHITLGTANPSIKPKESNDLLARWTEKGSGAETGISELAIDPRVEIQGDVKAVAARH